MYYTRRATFMHRFLFALPFYFSLAVLVFLFSSSTSIPFATDKVVPTTGATRRRAEKSTDHIIVWQRNTVGTYCRDHIWDIIFESTLSSSAGTHFQNANNIFYKKRQRKKECAHESKKNVNVKRMLECTTIYARMMKKGKKDLSKRRNR